MLQTARRPHGRHAVCSAVVATRRGKSRALLKVGHAFCTFPLACPPLGESSRRLASGFMRPALPLHPPHQKMRGPRISGGLLWVGIWSTWQFDQVGARRWEANELFHCEFFTVFTFEVVLCIVRLDASALVFSGNVALHDPDCRFRQNAILRC